MLGAAIDLGTNSVRLLIAEVDEKEVKEVYRDRIITRLGEGMDENDQLSEKACQRTLSALEKFAREIKQKNVNLIKVVGTSALREAQNSELITNFIEKKLNYELEVLSGTREAELIYQGIKQDLDYDEILCIDIGGGSTEFIYNLDFNSLNLGAVRLTEQYIANSSQPITKKEKSVISDKIKHELSHSLPAKFENVEQLVGLGGTITTLVAIKRGLKKYDPRLIHNYDLEFESIQEISKLLFQSDLVERKKIPGLEADRADIICAGVLILINIMEVYSFDKIIASEHGLLYGVLYSLLFDHS